MKTYKTKVRSMLTTAQKAIGRVPLTGITYEQAREICAKYFRENVGDPALTPPMYQEYLRYCHNMLVKWFFPEMKDAKPGQRAMF